MAPIKREPNHTRTTTCTSASATIVSLLCLLLAPLAASRSNAAERAAILGDDQLAARAAAIVVGRVVDIRSGRDLESRAAQRYVTIAVESDLIGTIAEREIVLKQPAADDAPGFAPEERVLLFLEPNPHDRTLTTVAGWQGKWTIESDVQGVTYAVRFDYDAVARGVLRG